MKFRRRHAELPARVGAHRLRGLFAVAALALAPIAASAAEAGTAPAAPSPQVDLDRLKRPNNTKPSGDLFGSRSWETPQRVTKAPPPPPPPPTAPPLPFAYVGRWQEKGQTIVVLSRDNQHYIAQAGEQLDASYVLESVDKDRLVIRYVPLGIAQTLPFASGAPEVSARAPQVPNELPRPRQKMPARDTDDEDD